MTGMHEEVKAQIAELTRLWERDQRLKQPVNRSDEIPTDFECITVDWLNDVLVKDVGGAQVQSFQIEGFEAGTTDRCKIFINYNDRGVEAGLPRKIFAKASYRLNTRLALKFSNCIHSEVTFYNGLRHLVDVNAPISYYAKYDPASYNSVILLKDISDTVDFCDISTRFKREHVENQLLLLAKLHATFYREDNFEKAANLAITWTDYFSALAKMDFEELNLRGLEVAEEVVPKRVFERRTELWSAIVESVRLQDRRDQTLCHGDVHRRNWYIAKDGSGTVGLSDWQCICRANWARDVAYAIPTNLSVEERRNWEKDLLRLYLDALFKAGGPKVSFDEAFTNYRQQLFAVLSFWTITLKPPSIMPDVMQPKRVSLNYIERLTHAIDDLDAFNAVRVLR